MQQSSSHIKDSSDFIKKQEEIKDRPKDAFMVTADVVVLYPSIFHNVGLEGLRRMLDDRVKGLIKMSEFVLKNNYFEFNGNGS